MGKKTAEFDIAFAVDCETSGINFGSENPSINHQSIAWGIIATNVKTYEVIEKLYVEIKYDDTKYMWNAKAEAVHGLSIKHLEEHGETEEDAAAIIGDFLMRHNGIKNPLILLGHNVGTFDRPFLRKLLHSNGLPFKFAHRNLDSFSASMATIKEYNSDDLFAKLGMPKRAHHNALEDAMCALKSFRIISTLWDKMINSQ